ncbi:uncharacterized protein N7506_005708 [Penicillium brevicompactum]|uniref:uncharacterized protein n=1 Tax=Penicillium brevicompactum TaxID=5074 RepID=UPI002542472D|nr:uncharacterized protein N7506_005708 [Penicillium brevicompactum]KAJ5335772.1 hypothetical protein N7506_005708 [Penicillium brevicompactum]
MDVVDLSTQFGPLLRSVDVWESGDSEVCMHQVADEGGAVVDSGDWQTTLDTYAWKPLPPVPLNLKDNVPRTPRALETPPVNFLPQHSSSLWDRTGGSDMDSLCPVRADHAIELDPNLDPKNKPLPLEPSDSSMQHQPPSGPENEKSGDEEPRALRLSPFPTGGTDLSCLIVGLTAEQGQLPVCLPDRVESVKPERRLQMKQKVRRGASHVDPSTEMSPPTYIKWQSQPRSANEGRSLSPLFKNRRAPKYVDPDQGSLLQSPARKASCIDQSRAVENPRVCYPQSPFEPEQRYGDTLLATFFGFDLMGQIQPLSGDRLHRVRHLLTTQLHPDLMVADVRYPILSCVWLRNFIVESPHRLEFDRGRLRGLRLEDQSSQNIHRGFGRLWDFLNACGPTPDHEPGRARQGKAKSKKNQILWFQVSR